MHWCACRFGCGSWRGAVVSASGRLTIFESKIQVAEKLATHVAQIVSKSLHRSLRCDTEVSDACRRSARRSFVFYIPTVFFENLARRALESQTVSQVAHLSLFVSKKCVLKVWLSLDHGLFERKSHVIQNKENIF